MMTLDPGRVKALCFDLDGTLMDSDDQLVLQLARWLTPFARIFPGHSPRKLARRAVMFAEGPANAMLTLLDRLGLDRSLATLNAKRYRRGWKSVGGLAMIPGTRAALERLQPHFPMAVVSTRGAPVVFAFLEQHHLKSLFALVVTGQTVGRTKPHPEPILWAAEQLGVPPAHCLMVGDTTVDVIAAKAAGAQVVGMLCGFGEAHELRQAGADLILPDVAALPPALGVA